MPIRWSARERPSRFSHSVQIAWGCLDCPAKPAQQMPLASVQVRGLDWTCWSRRCFRPSVQNRPARRNLLMLLITPWPRALAAKRWQLAISASHSSCHSLHSKPCHGFHRRMFREIEATIDPAFRRNHMMFDRFLQPLRTFDESREIGWRWTLLQLLLVLRQNRWHFFERTPAEWG